MTAMIRFSLRGAVSIGAFVFFSAALLLQAQDQGRAGGSPRFDAAMEATVSGTVESVSQLVGPAAGRGRRGLGGTHLVLTTSGETLVVHLGPTAFLNDKKVAITMGDTLVVTGSRVTVDGEPVFIAREVKKGDITWTLRDAAGRPLWRGPGGRPR